MWHDMFALQLPVLEKILRTVFVYLLILLLFRLGGRRSMAQLSMMDLTVMFLLSNVVQNAVIGNDNSLSGGAIGAVTLILANELIDYLCYRWPRLAGWLQGRTVEVITDGSPVAPALRRLRLSGNDIDRLVRLQNGNDAGEVKRAQLDPDGHLMIDLQERFQNATDGDIKDLERRLDRIEAGLDRRLDGIGTMLAELAGGGSTTRR